MLNILYLQWGVWSYVGPVCVALLGGVWWLIRESGTEIEKASLSLRSKLASVFQTVVIEEAERLLALVESRLPSSLSQYGETEPAPSAFDRLCQGLQRVDPDDLDREVYTEVLHQALAGEITREARRLIEGVIPPMDETSPQDSATRIRFGFEARTEQILSGIARETARCMRRERICCYGKRCALALFGTAFAGGALTASVAPLFNAQWAQYMGYLGVAVLGFMGLTGLVSLLIFVRVKEQHLNAAGRFMTPADIEEFLLSRAVWK